MSERYAESVMAARAFRSRWRFDPGHVTDVPGLLTKAECRAHKRRLRVLGRPAMAWRVGARLRAAYRR